MNRINPRKLLHSKWTAVQPRNKEKHFMVIEVRFSEEGELEFCEIEAVYSHRAFAIDWHELKDASVWQLGWR